MSLSSFIGVDGTNITLNSGRMLINLKPVATASASRATIIRRMQDETAEVTGISLYMQPVQDLTIDSTVSRTAVPVRARGRQSRRVRCPGCRGYSNSCAGCRSSRMWRAT